MLQKIQEGKHIETCLWNTLNTEQSHHIPYNCFLSLPALDSNPGFAPLEFVIHNKKFLLPSSYSVIFQYVQEKQFNYKAWEKVELVLHTLL